MIKTYCDCCGCEIVNKNRINGNKARVIASINGKPNNGNHGKTLNVEIVTASGSTWHEGDFCKYCVIDAINKADDRLRSEQ